MRAATVSEVLEARRRLDDARSIRNLPRAQAPGLVRLQLEKPAATEAEVLDVVAALNRGSARWTFTPVLRIGKAHVFPSGGVLVRFRDGVKADVRDRVLANAGLEATAGRLSSYGVVTARPRDESDPLAVLACCERLSRDASVEFAQPDFASNLETSVLPSDTYFANQWPLRNTGQTGGTPGADIRATDAWDISTGASTVTVAIVDGGVDITHPEFAGRVVTGYDATNGTNNSMPNAAEYHGTACAGLAVAAGNNGAGIAGVAWNASLMAVRIDDNGVTTDSQMADGILTAAFRGASVLSCSWGCSYPSPMLEFAISSVIRNGRGGKGCVVVFSAGNDGAGVGYPARLPGVISVGATDANDVRWSYSNSGPELTLVAPSGNHLVGQGLWTTDNRGSAGANPGNVSLGDAAGDYTNQFDGASAACPVVAGAAALLLSANSDLTASQVASDLAASATDLGPAGRDDQYGAGRLNVDAALGLVTGVVTVSGSISTNTVWHRGNIYKVVSTVSVDPSATLTIESGTIIKFQQNAGLSVSGTLLSQGTTGSPVVFTSFRDDSLGGDTNLDGPSVGSPGDWYLVSLGGGSYSLSNCRFRYGGGYWGNPNYLTSYSPTLQVSGFTGTLDNLSIEWPGSQYQSGALTAYSACTIQNCTVRYSSFSGGPVYGISVQTSGAPVVQNNKVVNAGIGIYASGWSGSGGLLQGNEVAGSQVGVRAVSVAGTTIASNVVRDAPYPASYSDSGIVVVNGASDCVVSGNDLRGRLKAGIWVSGGAGLQVKQNQLRDCDYGIVTNACAAAIQNNTFLASTSYGFPFYQVSTPWPSYPAANTVGSGWYGPMALGGSIAIDVTPGNFVVPENLTVAPGGVLRLGAGAIVKLWPNARIDAYGTGRLETSATGSPVVFTSSRDDSLGGDTNLDGPSVGSPGDWYSVILSGGSYTLTNCRFRYGGAYNNGYYAAPTLNVSGFDGTLDNLSIEWPSYQYQNGALSASSACTIQNCTVRFASFPGGPVYGISVQTSGAPVVQNNKVVNAGIGIYASGWSGSGGLLQGNEVAGSQVGVRAVSVAGTTIASNVVRDAPYPASYSDSGIVVVNGASDCVVSGNDLRGRLKAGIWVSGGAGLQVKQNQLRDCDYGIVTNACAAAIQNNTFLASTSYGFPLYQVSTPWPSFVGGETLQSGWYPAVALGGTIAEDVTPGDIGGFGFASYAVASGTQLYIGTNGVLRLGPGSIVKLQQYAGIQTGAGGVLASTGTPANPVVFTSYRDDSYGGDTNLDGPSSGQPGDWYQVSLSGGSYTLSGCTFRYGGASSPYAYPVLSVNGFTGTVSGNTIYAPLPAGYYSDGAGVYVGSTCTVSGNTVTFLYPGSGYGVRCASDIDAVISGNAIRNAGTGISIGATSSSLTAPSVLQNTLRGCSVAIAAVSANTSTNFAPVIGSNDIDSCATGIQIVFGNPNMNVTDNAVRNASTTAIWISRGAGWVQRNTCVQGSGLNGTGIGVRIEGGSSFTVSDNLINAFQTDLYVGPFSSSEVPTVDARRNHVLNAGNQGVWVDASPSSNAPAVGLIGNDLYGAANYDLYLSPSANGPSTSVAATGNWWGTTNTATIAGKIFDRLDNAQSPLADYSGLRSTPIMPDDPAVTVSPSGFSVFAFTGTGTDAGFTLGNAGIRTLTFQIDEAAGGVTEAMRPSLAKVSGTNLPWVSEGPVSGTVVGGASQSIGLHFDGSVVTDGDYAGSLVLTTNDPAKPLYAVPLDFTVAHVRIDAPVAGGSFQSGQVVTIRWSEAPGASYSSVDLALSTDAGRTYSDIANGLVDNGNHAWLIPNTSSDSCRIRAAVHTGASTFTGVSTGYFGIHGPLFAAITAPLGPLALRGGTSTTISWNLLSGDVKKVTVAYSLDGGASWTAIGDVTPPARSIPWTPPAISKLGLTLRVVAKDQDGAVLGEDVAGGGDLGIFDGSGLLVGSPVIPEAPPQMLAWDPATSLASWPSVHHYKLKFVMDVNSTRSAPSSLHQAEFVTSTSANYFTLSNAFWGSMTPASWTLKVTAYATGDPNSPTYTYGDIPLVRCNIARVSFNSSGPPVVLIHGFNARADMWGQPLISALDTDGYSVWTFEYPNRGDVRRSAGGLHAAIPKILANTPAYSKLDVIGWSLGTIVTRCYSLNYGWDASGTVSKPYQNDIRRFVSLAGPHQGAMRGSADLLTHGDNSIAGRQIENNSPLMRSLNDESPLNQDIDHLFLRGYAPGNDGGIGLRIVGAVQWEGPNDGAVLVARAMPDRAKLGPRDRTRFVRKSHASIYKLDAQAPEYGFIHTFLADPTALVSNAEDDIWSLVGPLTRVGLRGSIVSGARASFVGPLPEASELFVTADSAGVVALPALAIGTYRATFSSPGFRTRVTDFVVDALTGTSATVSLEHDDAFAGPRSPFLRISGDWRATHDSVVTVGVGADGAAQVMLSEDPAFAGASWQAPGAAIPWTFSGEPGTKVLFARYRSSGGIEGDTLAASVTLADSALGSVTVTSSPAGAQVYLDNHATGFQTPCVLDSVVGGPHLVTVHREGLVASPGLVSIDLSAGGAANASFTLTGQPAPGASTPISPTGGALARGPRPTLAWSSPSGSGPQVFYDVLLARDSTLADTLQSYLGEGTTSFVPSNGLPDSTRLYWSFRPVSSSGVTGIWSLAAAFRVDATPPMGKLLYPNGGESFAAGQAISIRWQVEDWGGVDSVGVAFSTDSSATYGDTLWWAFSGDTTHAVTLPATASGKGRARVIFKDKVGLIASDDSDSTFTLSGSVAVGDESIGYSRFSLSLLGPSPFSSSTRFSFAVPRPTSASLEVFGVNGGKVVTLFQGVPRPGLNVIEWRGESVGQHSAPAGLYFVRLRQSGQATVRRVVLVR